jgi:hypothetical protein
MLITFRILSGSPFVHGRCEGTCQQRWAHEDQVCLRVHSILPSVSVAMLEWQQRRSMAIVSHKV